MSLESFSTSIKNFFTKGFCDDYYTNNGTYIIDIDCQFRQVYLFEKDPVYVYFKKILSPVKSIFTPTIDKVTGYCSNKLTCIEKTYSISFDSIVFKPLFFLLPKLCTAIILICILSVILTNFFPKQHLKVTVFIEQNAVIWEDFDILFVFFIVSILFFSFLFFMYTNLFQWLIKAFFLGITWFFILSVLVAPFLICHTFGLNFLLCIKGSLKNNYLFNQVFNDMVTSSVFMARFVMQSTRWLFISLSFTLLIESYYGWGFNGCKAHTEFGVGMGLSLMTISQFLMLFEYGDCMLMYAVQVNMYFFTFFVLFGYFFSSNTKNLFEKIFFNKKKFMWGNVVLDTYLKTMFNTGFNNQKNSILTYLIKWQYFWWLWFSIFFLIYYFFFFGRLIFQINKFKLNIVTSSKSHGKWGDLLICILPVFWCVNILTNSNALLKILEWQTESNSFVLRVRGKQWYWSYKYTPETLNKLYTKNIILGTGKEVMLDSNLNNYYKKLGECWYINKHFKGTKEPEAFNYLEHTKYYKYLENWKMFKRYGFCFFGQWKQNNPQKRFLTNIISDFKINKNFTTSSNVPAVIYKNEYLDLFGFKQIQQEIRNKKLKLFKLNNTNYKKIIIFKNPIFKNKNLITISTVNDSKEIYRRYYLTIKQKARLNFSVKNDFTTFKKELNLSNTNKKTSLKSLDYCFTSNNRLLNVDNLLVLPTKVNTTVITNSFDVVHSWFIPGLGLKMDCVPGRSTHHNLYITTPGFYYGQCAEICGRLHHHMPIKICLLPIEHFFLWWNHFSLKYFDMKEISNNKNN